MLPPTEARSLCQTSSDLLGTALDMRLHFTSGYHPKGDGQTKCTNQTLKQYLHVYCNYQQDNWSELLPLAEFVYNNAPSPTTGVSPFFTNKEYHPNITVHPKHDIASSRAHDFAIDMLEPAISNTFSKRIQLAPAPVIIDREPKYEISWIVDSKIDRRWACKLLYKVIWLGYEDTGDESKWIPASKLSYAVDLVSDFHIAYPTKPGPLPLS